MAPWAKRATVRSGAPTSQKVTYEFNDYSLGFDTYTSNDKFPLINGASNFWRLAKDSRITALGDYESRKGLDFYSDAAGSTLDQSITSTTGAADQAFSDVTRLAQPFTATATGSVSRLHVTIKNANGATGTPAFALYTDNGGVPGTLIALSSVASTSLMTSYATAIIRFISAPTVVIGTQYWIVGYIQSVASGSYQWSSTTSATTAMVSTNSGSTWSATSYALNFQQYYASTGGTLGLERFYKSDGTKITLFAQGTTLYTVNDSTGALTAIKTGLNASATNYRFAIFGDVVYYVNGYDGYRKWDGTTESQILSTNYKFILSHKGLMFLAGGPDPNAIIFSNFGKPEVFTSTDFIYADAPKVGDPVTALLSLNGNMFIFARNNKFILSGSDNATFAIDEAPDQNGTYTQETVTQDDSFMYYLANDGVYQSNGSQATLLSKSNYQDILNLVNKTSACMAINAGRLYMWFPSPTSAVNNNCYVWNLNSPGGPHTLESLDTDAYVARAANAFLDSDNMLVASSVIGQVYWQELSTNDSNNLGGPINWILQTHYMDYAVRLHYQYFGGPAVLKGIPFWHVRLGTNSNSYTVDCQYASDKRDNWQTNYSVNVQGNGPIWGSGIIWGSFIWGTSQVVEPQMSMPGEYKRVAVRYVHSAMRQPVQFFGHTFVVQMRRLR